MLSSLFSLSTLTPVRKQNSKFVPMFSINSSFLDLPSLLDLNPDFRFESDSTSNSIKHADSGQSISIAEQRKLRRKISNRESARRSRARKQRHLEEIRVKLAKMKAENENLSSRLRAVLNRSKLVQYQNLQLTNESVILRHRLARARQALVFSQLQRLITSPCTGSEYNGSGYGFGLEQTLASLIS